MTGKIIALVDLDSFYASVESNSLFRPDLRTAAVIVASNSDGCVVARNRRSKQLGIKMGEPIFKITELIKRERVALFSSQYANYANMSERVMTILATFSPVFERYSIDEAFIDLTGQDVDLLQLGQQMKETVYKHTGLSVSVGVSVSKTLSKLASYAAKTYRATGGVVDLTCPDRRAKLMAITPVEEVWGVGRRLTEKLKALQIHTAADLAAADPSFIRGQFSIVLEKTVRELRGESIIDMETVPPRQKQIMHSRSFGNPISTLPDMREAVHSYAVKAVEKMRKQGLVVKVISVFIQTSPFKPESYYSKSAVGNFPIATNDTRLVLAAASEALAAIWKDNKRYIRAGVALMDLQPAEVEQFDFMGGRNERDERLMNVIDNINAQGKTKVFFASQGIGEKHWTMKRQFLSPHYLTRWSDIPIVT